MFPEVVPMRNTGVQEHSADAGDRRRDWEIGGAQDQRRIRKLSQVQFVLYAEIASILVSPRSIRCTPPWTQTFCMLLHLLLLVSAWVHGRTDTLNVFEEPPICTRQLDQ